MPQSIQTFLYQLYDTYKHSPDKFKSSMTKDFEIYLAEWKLQDNDKMGIHMAEQLLSVLRYKALELFDKKLFDDIHWVYVNNNVLWVDVIMAIIAFEFLYREDHGTKDPSTLEYPYFIYRELKALNMRKHDIERIREENECIFKDYDNLFGKPQ